MALLQIKLYHFLQKYKIFMFTVLVCTRNSARVIQDVLKSILNQIDKHLINKILIVDFNSNDETLLYSKQVLNINSIDYELCNINTPGKSSALIYGLNKCNTEYIIILDDDNILEVDFITNAKKILLESNNIGCLGSMGLTDINQTYPNWFHEYKPAFAIGLPIQGSDKDWVWGAASIIKMECWNKLKKSNFRFLLEVERMGHNIPVKIGGEDVELSLAIKKIGYDIDFSKSLKFIHKFDASRLSESYLISNNKGVSASVPIHEIYRSFIYNKKFSQLVLHYRINKKIGIALFVLLKSILNGNKLAIKMSYSTFIGIIKGYLYFFSKLKNYSNLIENLK